MANVKAVVGLGNPGAQYETTRHNAGFWVVDRLASRLGARFRPELAQTLLGPARWEGCELVLVKPQTFMNKSGVSVKAVVERYGLSTQDVLVVYDDLALEPGAIRLRQKGSSGGHNGIKSVIHYLGTELFPRLRVGIGPVPEGMSGVDYVLGSPSASERARIDAAVAAACDAVLEWSTHGSERAMARFNGVWGADGVRL